MNGGTLNGNSVECLSHLIPRLCTSFVEASTTLNLNLFQLKASDKSGNSVYSLWGQFAINFGGPILSAPNYVNHELLELFPLDSKNFEATSKVENNIYLLISPPG